MVRLRGVLVVPEVHLLALTVPTTSRRKCGARPARLEVFRLHDMRYWTPNKAKTVPNPKSGNMIEIQGSYGLNLQPDQVWEFALQIFLEAFKSSCASGILS